MVAATALTTPAEEPFERFFAQEYGRCVSIAFRITRDPAQAEDAAQEAFVRCLRSGKTGERPWLYTVVTRVALNLLRTRRRAAMRESRELRLRIAAEPADSDPQTAVLRSEDRAAVRRALLRVGERNAQILALRYAGLPYREIAAAVGCDVAQVGTRLARAERAFKKEIERGTP